MKITQKCAESIKIEKSRGRTAAFVYSPSKWNEDLNLAKMHFSFDPQMPWRPAFGSCNFKCMRFTWICTQIQVAPGVSTCSLGQFIWLKPQEYIFTCWAHFDLGDFRYWRFFLPRRHLNWLLKTLGKGDSEKVWTINEDGKQGNENF